MRLTQLRDFCMAMPGATEQIQWGKDLVFKVGGKMFCVANTDPTGAEMAMSFKCDPDTFAELCEREGCRPAPYLARAQWVGVERLDTLPDRELKPLVARAYELIESKLPKKTRNTTATKGTKVPKKTNGMKTASSRRKKA